MALEMFGDGNGTARELKVDVSRMTAGRKVMETMRKLTNNHTRGNWSMKGVPLLLKHTND